MFRENCALCYRIGDAGTAIGPDLTALTDTSDPALLTAVLDPNRAVVGRYASYIATTTEGRALIGTIVSETGGGIVLATVDGQRHELPRARIESLRATGRSLMPVGLEESLSPGDLADLFTYLRSAGNGDEKN